MEFIVYLGNQKEITISGNGLSKVYRFEKGLPTPIDNMQDKFILLRYKETVRSACCGTKANSFPFMEDYLYCRYQNLDAEAFRNKWTKYWTDLLNGQK